jgi:hypothetical protein
MRDPMWLLALALAAVGCSGEPAAPLEIQHSLRGTWTGVTADGISVEMRITNEGTECCLRAASGQGRIVSLDGDTIDAGLDGINQIDHVLLNFLGVGYGQPMLGQFSGQFADGSRLEGLMIGPEAFGKPPAGPFGGDSVAIQLQRE